MASEKTRQAGHSRSEPAARVRQTALRMQAGAAHSCRRRDCPPVTSPVAQSAHGGFPSPRRRFAAAGRAGAALALLLLAALAALPAQAQADTAWPVPTVVEADTDAVTVCFNEDIALNVNVPASGFMVVADGSTVIVGTVLPGFPLTARC